MVSTRHVNKNRLSFECPGYYDLGDYPNSDVTYKSIVALSKQDRECELYVMVHRKNTFDLRARENMELIEEYLRFKNYNDIEPLRLEEAGEFLHNKLKALPIMVLRA